MIEIVYKDEKQPTEEKTVNNLPKNVRQIGEPDSRFRVYMEDFAYTYLQKNGSYRPEQVKVCVLYGEEKEKDGQPVLFVQSAARLEVQEVQGEKSFHEPDWKVSEGIRKKFFPQQDVLGWAVISGSQESLLLEQVKTIHRHHFTGQHQILFWSDGGEREEILFNAGAGELQNLNGYYIYYEENRSMREFMISHNPTDADRVGEPADQAVKEFRQAVARKKSARPGAAGQLVRVAAAACVVFAIAGVLRYTRDMQKEGGTKTTAAVVAEQGRQNSGISPDEETKETAAQAISEIKTSSVNLTEADDGKENVATEPDQAVSASGAIVDNAQSASSSTETVASEVQTDTAGGPEVKQGGENTTEADASSAAASAEGYRAYQVKTGDTISSISQTYYGNMSMVDEICSLNHIEEQDLIYTGQILLLP